MAMEDLLRIAERTEDLPDQALAQIAASGGGIESVIAASEMKARNDIRQDAQMMRQQAQPPVVDQLINMAMRQPMPPMGAAMPPQMQQPMGQPMPPQMGMQQPMPQPTPPQMAPDMAQLAQQMGVPAMNTGGLIRRFQNNQGTIGGNDFFDFYQQQLGYDPRSILAGNVQAPAGFSLTPEQIEQLQEQYETAMSGTGIYSDQVEAAAQTFSAAPRMRGPAQTGPRTQQEAMDRALEEARLGAASNLLTSSGLPRGNIQSLMPVGSQTPVQAFVPGGQQRTVLPSGYSLFSPTAASGPPAGSAGGPPTQTDQSLIADQQAPAQAQDNEQTDTKKPPLRGLTGNQMLSLSYQGPEFLQGSSPTGLDPRLGAFTTGSGPASSTTSKVTQNLNDELMQGLIDKVNAYDTTIDDATAKMKTLEADLPTRENIKDRIKEQTRLGMAKSFFDAAGSGSPDFLTALAQGMGGAAGVMNKMTGEEQKELHQHALQMFQLEREKANTANARQEKALTRLQAARQYEQTRQIADRDNYVKLLQFQRDYNKDQFEINKANADFRESFRDALAQSQKDFDTQTNLHTNTDQQFLADSDQLDMKIAVDSFGRRGVPAAQRLERKAVKTLIRDMNAEAKNLTDEQRQLPLAQQEGIIAANLRNRYEEDKLVGLEAALDQHGKYLRSVFGSRGTDRYDSALEQYLQEFPHLNSNLFTENVAPNY
jgi:hypothetical protein